MNGKSFVRKSFRILLLIELLLSFALTKWYIEDSYAHMAAQGLIGTPSPIGLFLIYLFLWILGLLVFLVLDIVHSVIKGKEGGSFFGKLWGYLWRSLLYFPLVLIAANLAAYFVKI